MMRRPLTPVLLLAAFALLACENKSSALASDPDTFVRPATLAFYSDPEVISLPDTAIAGIPFTARVRSYGGGCVAQDQTFSGVSGRSAYIRPFVREPVPTRGLACPDILLIYTHEVVLVFNEPGTATVHVYGRREPGDAPITLTRTLHVRSTGGNEQD